MPETPIPVEVLCCYSHTDEIWLRRLETHLSSLKRQGLITFWHDRCIVPGTDWAKTIDTHLETASVILLLVSADFLASDYCYGIEMKRALERHAANEARVVPILVRSVDWTDTPFSYLQALPTNARPITSWRSKDRALADVAARIRRVIEDVPLLRENVPGTVRQAVQSQQQTTVAGNWKLTTKKGVLFLFLHKGGTGSESDGKDSWPVTWAYANGFATVSYPTSNWKLIIDFSKETPEGYRAADNQGSPFLGYVQKHHLATVQSLANKRLVKKAPPDWRAFSFELWFSQDGASYMERHIDSNGQPYSGTASVVGNSIRLQSPNSPYYTVISDSKGVEYLNNSPTGVVYELLWGYNLAEEFADARLPRSLRRFRPGGNFTCQFLPNGEYMEQREGDTQIVPGSWIMESNVTIEEKTYPVVIYISGMLTDAEYSFRLYSDETGLKTISYRNGQFFGLGTAQFTN